MKIDCKIRMKNWMWCCYRIPANIALEMLANTNQWGENYGVSFGKLKGKWLRASHTILRFRLSKHIFHLVQSTNCDVMNSCNGCWLFEVWIHLNRRQCVAQSIVLLSVSVDALLSARAVQFLWLLLSHHMCARAMSTIHLYHINETPKTIICCQSRSFDGFVLVKHSHHLFIL